MAKLQIDNVVPLDKAAPEKVAPKFPDTGFINGQVKNLNTAENLVAMMKFLGIEAKRNMMNLEPELHKIGSSKSVVHPEMVRSHLIGYTSRFDLPKTTIDDHLSAIMQDNQYHPIKDWLSTGKWDGIERVNNVIDTLNLKEKGLGQAVMKHFLVGCVASVIEKKFSSKLVPVLQGDQSYMKTAWISRLFNIPLEASASFLEGTALNPENKDSIARVIKHWVVELAELEQTTKRGQGELKAFLTSPVDVLRLPYARTETRKPRQTNCVATVNGTDFLKDETGSTRFAVLEMAGLADIDSLNKLLGWEWKQQAELTRPELLKQFWLEVKALYDNGHSWHLPRETALMFSNDINDKHTDKGGYYNMIREKYTAPPNTTGIEAHSRWAKTSELCEWEKIAPHQSGHVGRALAKLAKEGLIKKKITSGYSMYYIYDHSEATYVKSNF